MCMQVHECWSMNMCVESGLTLGISQVLFTLFIWIFGDMVSHQPRICKQLILASQ